MWRGKIDRRGCQVKCRRRQAQKRLENQLAKGIAPNNN